MKQTIDPRIAGGIIAVVVLVVLVLLWRSFAGGSAPVGAPPLVHPSGGGSRARVEEMRKEHMGR